MIFNLFFAWLLILFLGYLFSFLFFKRLSFSFRLILSFGLGSGVITFLMTILGFLYNFQLNTFLTVYAILLIFLFWLNRKNLAFKIKSLSGSKFLVAIFPFILFSLLHIFLFPELYRDSLIYAEWTKILYKDKRINFIEGGPSIALGFASNYPSAYQLLGVFIYLFTGENLVFLRLTSLFISFLLILFVYYWSKELFKNNLSFYSILLFISLPSIIFFSRSASQYIYLTFQFSLACYFLWKFLLEKERKSLYVSSIFAGFSALTSYLGLLFLFLWFLSFQLNKKFYKSIILSFFLFFVIISPWYLRNLIILGNPIWPFGGGKYIDPFIRANSLDQLNKISKVSGFNYDNLEDLKNSLIRLFFSYVDYSNASIYHALNPIFTLFAIPAIFFWVRNRDEKFKFFVLWFLILLAIYIVAATYWSKYLVLISIPTVFLSTYFIKSLQKFRVVKYCFMLFLAFLYFNSLYLALFWDECPQGMRNFSEYLGSLGNYQKILEICYGSDAKLWEWVNKNLPENEIIATNDFKLYYFNKTMVELSSWKLRGLYYSSSINESVKILKENNVSYLVLVGAAEEVESYPQYFKIIKEIDGKKVYKII
jgi:hypothetical protein